jgi:hypothetical protein
MPRPPHLVCQFLENVSADFLAKYQDLVKQYASGTGRHGIYALYRKDRLYYVGLASNLRGRLKSHLRDRHAGAWDRFSLYITVSDDHIRELEAMLLRIVQPRGNSQKGKFRRAENLKIVIAREMRRRSREEQDELLGRKRKPKPKLNGHARPKRGAKGVAAIVGRLDRPVVLRGFYKDKVYKARLRTNGTVRWSKQVYESPGFAASAVVGRPVNGFWFWRYQRAPGQWVRLREIKHN